MDNFSNFIREGAKFMAADRPDVFTLDEAARTLAEWFSILSAHDMEKDEDVASIASGGFELRRNALDDGINEYFLSRSILSFTTFDPEGESAVFNWTQDGKLVDINLDVNDN